MTSISTIGLQLIGASSLLGEQSNLAQLDEQLASNQQFNDLTDYTPSDASNLMNFQNSITQKQAYIASMQSVSTRLTVYDQSLTDLENIAAQTSQLAEANPTQNTGNIGSINAQIQAFLQQAGDDLNQEVGGRYIFAGTRYTTQPVNVPALLSGTITLPFTPTDSSALPTYDSQYGTATSAQIAEAYTKDSAAIDTNNTVQYGVVSDDPAFQNLIAGMQLINQATQTGVSAATYSTDMSNAATLINTALTSIQAIHTNVAANTNTITQEQTTQNNDIATLQGQIGDIQNVNLTQVGTEINTLQSQLQASYSATATIEQLSILKYL